MMKGMHVIVNNAIIITLIMTYVVKARNCKCNLINPNIEYGYRR